MNSAVLSAAATAAKAMRTTGFRRTFASTGPVHPGYKKIKVKYQKYQVEDGTPIHLKGGIFDQFLYRSTILLCGVGVALSFEYYYTAGFPKKD